MNETGVQLTKIKRQLKEHSRIRPLMDNDAGAGLLNPYAQTKVGSDAIFAWWARYKEAVATGADAVNGTIGALLEDDGSLAINAVVDEAVRKAPPVEIAAYAPLKGLPAFLDLAKTLALGDRRGTERQSHQQTQWRLWRCPWLRGHFADHRGPTFSRDRGTLATPGL